MLRRSPVCFASKISGGHAKNQARPPVRRAKQFHVYLNTPVSTKEPIKSQRHRYGRDAHTRVPEYRPGANVKMDDTFTLWPTVDGVMSVRKSRINPAFKWVDIDPDIQKVRRARGMRAELGRRSATTFMQGTNEDYRPELDNMQEPRWRERVMTTKRLTERFVDPNLLARGVVEELTPLDRYSYE